LNLFQINLPFRPMKKLKTLLTVAFAVATASVTHAADDVLIADFEGPDYGAWKATGEAFGSGPARGALAGQIQVKGFLGKGLVNTFLGGDDALRGVAEKARHPLLPFAHRVADFVCTQPGATPPMPPGFAAEFVGSRRTEGDSSRKEN
jgi:hypothetical protein